MNNCGRDTHTPSVMLSLPKHPAVRRIFRYARFFDYAQNDTENFEFY